MSATRLALVSVLLVVLLAIVVSAYNDDRPVYKWSPLWFNSYLRRGVLHKRYNDDSPIYKWSPTYFNTGYRHNMLKRACIPEWGTCRNDGRLCCSGACFEGACIGSGDYYDGEYER